MIASAAAARQRLKNHVGLGAESEASGEPEAFVTLDFVEVLLETAEDVALVKKHLEDIRIATGAGPVLAGANLRIYGRGKALQKAHQLIRTLVATGEWVAFAETFVASEETRENRLATDGPIEQLLLKVAEGPLVQAIERHLKAMERAAQAEQLKITSKPIAGKRTLMIDGTRAAHERVKLMVKELAEYGQSPMLNKAIIANRLGVQTKVVPGATEKSAVAFSSVVNISSSSSSVSGIISCPAVLVNPSAPIAPSAPSAPLPPATPVVGAGMRLMPGPRLLGSLPLPPKPKPKPDLGPLFAGLPDASPAPDATSGFVITDDLDLEAGPTE